MPELLRNLYSPNFDIKKRSKNSIKFIIIHYTGMKKEIDAIKKLTNSKSLVSCHYFIKNNGEILKMVPDSYVAWHAGKSNWKAFSSINKNSIGIEINNPGHQHGYRSFGYSQIKSLIKILRNLKKKYRIKKENILGHSDIAPERKKDPGEKFPWEILAKKDLCEWPKKKISILNIHRSKKIEPKLKKEFFKNLHTIGYQITFKKHTSKKFKLITLAFQRKFRNQLVNGIVDMECYLISKNLVHKS